jgi:hypothetical protein
VFGTRSIGGEGTNLQLFGLAATIFVTGASPGVDPITVNELDGDDVVDASGVATGSALLTMNGDAGDDVLIDGEVVTDGLVAGQDWLAAHTRLVDGQSVLDLEQTSYVVPAADLVTERSATPTA